MFEKIIYDTNARLEHAKRWVEEAKDRLEHLERRQFGSDNAPKSKREYREMLEEAKQAVAEDPTRDVECQAFLEWLKTVDRSNPRLKSVACLPAPQRRFGQKLKAR